jgi:ubiquinone/menaquinone biosynthesis C-methylase UbiE
MNQDSSNANSLVTITDQRKAVLVEGTLVAMKRVWRHWFRAYVQATFPGCRILSTGCGKGGALRYFRDPRHWATGCDLDYEAVRQAASVFPVCVGDLYKLPYLSETFDFVVCDWVFEHLAHTDLALGECHRVLKPNGMMAILTTNPHSPLGWIAKTFPRLGNQFWKRSLGIEQSLWEKGHRENSAGFLTRYLKKRGMRRIALYRISHMEYYFINLKLFVPIARLLVPLVRLYDSICQLPPFSLFANAYLALFQKSEKSPEQS